MKIIHFHLHVSTLQNIIKSENYFKSINMDLFAHCFWLNNCALWFKAASSHKTLHPRKHYKLKLQKQISSKLFLPNIPFKHPRYL